MIAEPGETKHKSSERFRERGVNASAVVATARLACLPRRTDLLITYRQAEAKGCRFSRGALDADLSAMGFDDSLGDVQS